MQRGGQVVLRMLANVQQKTIQPIIEAAMAKGTRIHTDEYDIYARLPAWGYQHKTVCHGRGEYARDEDGDGFCEIHVNTIEGTWSLLRSWLRPHRGISQEKLPLYLGFFESCTTPDAEAKLSLAPSSRLWSCDVPPSPRSPTRATFVSHILPLGSGSGRDEMQGWTFASGQRPSRAEYTAIVAVCRQRAVRLA